MQDSPFYEVLQLMVVNMEKRKMKKFTVLVLALCLVAFVVSCSDDDDDTISQGEVSFDISHVVSKMTNADSNPEIVRMVPGTDDQAVVICSAANTLLPITYTATDFTFGTAVNVDPGSSTSETTSIDISIAIDGTNYIAVCVAEADCAPGRVLLVSYPDMTTVASVTIGYNPDGCAFTKDGSFLVVACEDDREDRACKPDDRWGGSVAIIDLTDGVENASLAQLFMVDWAEDSEPEHAETAEDGTTIVSVQETSQVIIFNVNDAPLEAGEYTVVDLPDDDGGNPAEPDGMYITPDGLYGVISNEKNGSFYMLDLATGEVLSKTTIEDDLTKPPYTFDERKATKRTEPEECSVVEWGGNLYAVFALQESHGVVVYDITDPVNPMFDSADVVGLDPENDMSDEGSEIGCEGLAAHPTNGVILTANERQGSVSMLVATGNKN